MSDNEQLASFVRYAQTAGAQVSVVPTQADGAALITTEAADPIRCAASVAELYPGFIAALASAGRPAALAEEIAASEPDRSALASALADGTGLVAARAAIAETGSVVLAENALAPRLLGMLADVCVALLPASAILPTLDEAGALLAELDAAGQRYVSLVTGPSRTADIERVLTIGVQGPKALHIIILAEI